MIQSVKVIQLSDELTAALELMEANNISHLPVLDNKKLVGIISMTDVKRVRYLSEFADDGLSASTTFQVFDIEEVMTKNVKTVEENTPIQEVAKLFSIADFHAMPVMNGDQIVGIISVKDVLKYYSSH
jgi:CBS domain-containing protein